MCVYMLENWKTIYIKVCVCITYMADIYRIESIHMVQFLSRLQFLLSGENANPSRSKLKPESQFS